jgi:hypothetical protein
VCINANEVMLQYTTNYTAHVLQVTTNAWFTQLRYISAVHFSLEAFMVNEFQGSSMDCSAGLGPELASLAESALVTASGVQRAVMQQLTRPQEG